MIPQILLFLFCIIPITASVDGPLRVASSFTSPPLAFLKKGSPVGLEVEVVQHIAHQMGKEIEWVIHNSGVEGQDSHDDIVLGYSPSQRRGKDIPYYTTCWALLQTESDTPSLTVLKTACWARMDTWTPPQVFGEAHTIYVAKQGFLSPLVDLTQKKIPGWIHPLPSLLYLRFAAPELHCIVFSELSCPLTLWVAEEWVAATQAALQELEVTSTLESLASRWLVYDQQPKIICLQEPSDVPNRSEYES